MVKEQNHAPPEELNSELDRRLRKVATRGGQIERN